MYEKIIKNIDREYIHSITKELSLMGNEGGKYGFRCSGSSGEWQVSTRIAEEMKSIGLKDVATETFPVDSWEILDGTLTVNGLEMPMSSYCGVSGTVKEGITAEIVDVGRGTAADYEGVDVKGKLALCTFDILDDFWISLPAYEAELRGAAGLIITYAGDMYGTKEDAINSFDSQCKHGFPVGNISRKNAIILRELLSEGPVTGNMMLDIKMDFEGKSSNVIGYIPGKDKSKMILLGGHMDGYFHSYQDDLLGVGINLGIAKAMIEVGYEPEHTIGIIAHGSEEYGIKNQRYDWCIGSYNSINNIHPDWFGKLIAFFNIDAVRPGTPVYNIASTPEYHGLFNEYMKTMTPVPESSWPGGSALLGLNGPWDDGFNYAIKGVPTVICGRGPAEWSYQNYHTQFDNYEIYEGEHEIIEYVAAQYTEMVMVFDKFKLPPLSFDVPIQGLRDSLADIPDSADVSEEVAELKKRAEEGIMKARALFRLITDVNRGEKVLDCEDTRIKLLEIYRQIEGDLFKLGPWDDVVFAHEVVADNVKHIADAIDYVSSNSFDKAVEAMWNVDLFKVAYQFHTDVYRWLMECQDYAREDLYWGTGKLHQFAELETVANMLKNKSLEAKAELENLLIFETSLLKNTLLAEVEILKTVIAKTDSIITNR